MAERKLPARAKARDAERKLQTELTLAQSNFRTQMDLGTIPVVANGERAFTKLGILGRGGFGSVYKAEHPEFGIVALKKQPLFRGGNEEVRAVMEKRFLHAMDNPFILKSLGYFEDAEDIWLVLPFAKYGTYKRLMYVQDELAVKPFYAQLVCALKYLHAAKITHGDVKPENVLIFEGGHLKLADFGLAKDEVEGSLTFYGTPAYMAPEIVLGKSHGNTVDWWAFGVMLYKQLMGRHPYVQGGVNRDDLKRILDKPLEALKEAMNTTADAEDLIKQTLEWDPSKRAGRDEASIEAIFKHGWFRNIHFNVYLDPSYVVPEFEKLRLEECPMDMSFGPDEGENVGIPGRGTGSGTVTVPNSDTASVPNSDTVSAPGN